MHILKLYMKIVKDQRNAILIYTLIFLGIFTVAAITNASKVTSNYESVKVDVAYIDEDHSELSRNIKTVTEANANIVNIGTSLENQKDALFYSRVSIIVVVPKGFMASFEKGKPMELQIQQRPNDVNAGVVTQKLNGYLNTLQSYRDLYPQKSLQKLHTMVESALSKKASIKLENTQEGNKLIKVSGSYFNYLSYIMLSIIIMAESLTMLTIFKSEVMKRNFVSPMKSTSMNLQLIAGNLIFGIALWLVFTMAILILNPKGFLTLQGAIMAGNSFLFTVMCVCLAFLITALFARYEHASDAVRGAENVLGLGCSFLGGAFVPQMLMSKEVLDVAKFIPTYWYVKLNDMLANGTAVFHDVMQQMLTTYGILILFAIAFLGMALVLMKSRKSQGVLIDTTNAN